MHNNNVSRGYALLTFLDYNKSSGLVEDLGIYYIDYAVRCIVQETFLQRNAKVGIL